VSGLRGRESFSDSLTGDAVEKDFRPLIAFIFPGQGSQKVGMGKALADAHPIVRETFAEADAALGEPLSRLCFEGPETHLTRTENTQPAILATSVAVYRLIASRGLMPNFVAGHSLGEYSANVAAGTFGFADALRIVRKRGRYMQEAVSVGEGAMAAVLGLDADAVARACADARRELTGRIVSPANLNAPGQVVIAGHRDAVARAGERAKTLGAKRVVPLAVSAPFHCALMTPAAARLAPELRALPAADPRVPIVANVDAEPKRDARSAIEALVRQVSAPVRWEDVVRRLASDGVRTYVEVGPGTVLAGLVRKIDRAARVVSVEDEKGLAEASALTAERS
jgi:[acyl-carrier-protein] S-malonyltransferase